MCDEKKDAAGELQRAAKTQGEPNEGAESLEENASESGNGAAEDSAPAEKTDAAEDEENSETFEESAPEQKPKSRARKIVSIVTECILGAIVAFLLLVGGILVYDKYINKSRAPSVFGYSQFVIATGSMEPEISVGDMIIVKNTGDYAVGDVITFFMGDGAIPTTHRIIEIRVENGVTSYITKGDANNAADPAVRAENVVGEVVSVLPNVGLFFEWVKTPSGIICIVLLVGIIVALIFIKVL